MIRNRATIRGIVQGIGFRPFVFKLAKQWQLCGYIRNNSVGVELEVEGDKDSVENFFRELESNPLPLAQIFSIERKTLPPINYTDFEIRGSETHKTKYAFIPPDMSICDDCLREMFDPNDRRYRYPFINCTNCGPRYTIIKDVPYDRPKTSMVIFQMCSECLAEYHDPSNRRFHAQPNACPVCGPRVELFDAKKQKIKTVDPIAETVRLLRQGAIVAVKGLGGFHLAVDAENDGAVKNLRLRKFREEKPLALMAFDIEKIRQFAHVSENDRLQLQSPRRPIVLLPKKAPNSISQFVAPKNHFFGVMLPYTPLHYLLLDDEFLALVMTSGNMTDEPIVIDNDEAFRRLGEIADYFLIHNRDIYLRSDDSIVRTVENQTTIIRRARGFVPQPILLSRKFPRILTCGAELKNTVCLAKENQAIVSQHIGDLKTEESYRFFLMTIDHLKKLFDIQPEIIGYDLHPDYLSTKYAQEQQGVIKIGVQHHHAHILSCVAEHNLEGPVLGLSFDGTGYGTDGKIWGGEMLLVEGKDFTRLAHLEYLPMPGGDKAIKEPWRMVLSGLFQTYGEEFLDLPLHLFKKIPSQKKHIILQMIKNRFNSPDTSSLGRLFDLVASLLNICQRATYEGQPAIMLEQHAPKTIDDFNSYDFHFQKDNGIYTISSTHLIRQIVQDLLAGEQTETIAGKFHRTLITMFTNLCVRLSHETAVKRVALSGGVFQNIKLLNGMLKELSRNGFDVYFQQQVPTNDGGISLGQAAFVREFVEKC